MCGRVSTLCPEEVDGVVRSVAHRLALNALPDWPAQAMFRAEAYPGSPVDVIVPDDGSLVATKLIWGYPVQWQKRRIFNTRIEKALDGCNMWTRSIAQGRCVVPVASYFEPHSSETLTSKTTGKPIKRSYMFTMPDCTPMLLAGVCEGDHFSVLTTAPNEVMAPIHARMPLMLAPMEVEQWLHGDFAQLADRSHFTMLALPEDEVARGMQGEFASTLGVAAPADKPAPRKKKRGGKKKPEAGGFIQDSLF